MTADQSVRFLKGVGERRAAQFEKLGIATLRDLVRHFPREYEDWSQPTPLSEAPLGEDCCVRAIVTTVVSTHPVRRGMTLYRFGISDGFFSDATGARFQTRRNAGKYAASDTPHNAAGGRKRTSRYSESSAITAIVSRLTAMHPPIVRAWAPPVNFRSAPTPRQTVRHEASVPVRSPNSAARTRITSIWVNASRP